MDGRKAEKPKMRGRRLTIFLAGVPNVVKSVFFNRLTGINAIVSNYPGTTVEVMRGVAGVDGEEVEITDLPGTYGLGALSEDQEVAVRAILEENPDAIINIVDASRLERSLVLTLQLLELGIPVVVALNQVDFAEKRGIMVDHAALSRMLGVPVIPTVATKGVNVKRVLDSAVKVAERRKQEYFTLLREVPPPPRRGRGFGYAWGRRIPPLNVHGSRRGIGYSPPIEHYIGRVERAIMRCYVGGRVAPRVIAKWLLEGDLKAAEIAMGGRIPGWLLAEAEAVRREMEWSFGEPSSIKMAKERLSLAGWISRQVVREKVRRKPTLQERLDSLLLSYSTGIPFLLLVLAGIFAIIFLGGGWLESLIASAFEDHIEPLLESLIGYTTVDYLLSATSNLALLYGEAYAYLLKLVVENSFSYQILAKFFLIDGLMTGVEAAFSIAFPYVVTFYIALAILEDTGYLSRIAYLMDLVLHKFGLHGKSIIPLRTAWGCSVPAIMSTRILESRKQRLMVTFLIVLLPCSARTAIILGSVGYYGGIQYALAIYALVIGIVALLSVALSKVLPGVSPSMLMEMPPYRVPALSSLASKTWIRTREFFKIAFPLIIVGSLILALLEVLNLIDPILYASAGFMENVLGLPSITSVTLIYGLLRKEMALETLLVIAKLKLGVSDMFYFMTPMQMFIYALVVTLYFPCIATFAVIFREMNLKTALAISALAIMLAILTGATVYHVYLLLNPTAPEPLITNLINTLTFMNQS